MPLSITTTSSTQYMVDKDNAIFPAFVDNMPYNSSDGNAIVFYFQLKASGGLSYTWKILSGSLPTGLELTPEGKIQGTPIEEGTFTFTIEVRDGYDRDEKQLVFVAEPYRSKWMAESKFGGITHWGRFSEYPLTEITGNEAFVARTVNFNADQWATQFENMGMSYIEFSAIQLDSFRNWPSQRPTRYELKSSRDYVGEIITAFHAKGMKVGSYYPPDFPANLLPYIPGTNISQRVDYDAADTTWGTMNKYLIYELIEKGLDYVYYDVGGSSELFPFVPYRNLQWDDVMPGIRYRNPYFCIAVNPGTRKGGYGQRELYTDYEIYEPAASADSRTLEVAIPLAVTGKKKAIQVTALLSKDWAFREGYGTNAEIKDPDAIIENLKKNWAVSASVALAIPVRADGLLIDPIFQPALTKVGNFAFANKAISISPKLKQVDNTLVIFPPGNSRVYYTLDGTTPNEQSKVYTKPIPIKGNMVLKAKAKEPNKSLSVEERYVVENQKTNTSIKLLNTISGNVVSTDNSLFYHGMFFVVNNKSIRIKRIGRKFVSPIKDNHRFIFRRQYDKMPMCSGTMVPNNVQNENGYEYVAVSDTILKRGSVYYLAIKEGIIDQYFSNSFSVLPETKDLRIISPCVLSKYGDFNDIVSQSLGQYIDIDYEIVEESNSPNLVLGRQGILKSLAGGNLNPSGGNAYGSNAVDEEPESVAAAGGQFGWMHLTDLQQVQTIHRIELNFLLDFYATEFAIYTSLDAVSLTAVVTKTDNRLLSFVIEFEPRLARYIHIRATKPNAAGQEGIQMVVSTVKAI
jgi:hypothetical protein